TTSAFFFSSRRRHTRFSRDWSSDVCSSDLACAKALIGGPVLTHRHRGAGYLKKLLGDRRLTHLVVFEREILDELIGVIRRVLHQIGRASCRERAWVGEGGGAATGRGRTRRQ